MSQAEGGDNDNDNNLEQDIMVGEENEFTISLTNHGDFGSVSNLFLYEDEISEDIDSSQVEPGLLIEQARSEQTAFVQLYRRNYDDIFRYCAHRLFARVLAEDMTSAVFLKAIENFHNFMDKFL